jgi:hypothetical protein
MDEVAVWGLICLLVGAGFFANALWIYRGRRRFLRSAVRVEGRVVEVQIQGVGRNAVSVPVLEFVVGAQQVRTEALTGTGFQRFAIGQSTPVRYDPVDPRRVGVDTFAALWGTALLRSAFGAVFTLMGAVALILSASAA